MKTICIVYGGDSPESEISVLTSLKVYKELKSNNIPCFLVYLNHKGEFFTGKALENVDNYLTNKFFSKGKFIKINRNYYFLSHLKKQRFDEVLILGHGPRIEDGTVASYFQTKNIPYLYDDLSNASLIQDKSRFKMIMDYLKIKQTSFEIIYKHQFEKDNNLYLNLKYPLIVKPANLGSSIGIKKVNNKEELIIGLNSVFEYDETAVIEEYVVNKKEYNIALVGYENKRILSQIELVSDNAKVLSFYDKYDYSNKNEKRIINPLIEDSIKEEIERNTLKVFTQLNLCGIYRFDYIFDTSHNVLYLNEINVVPGSLAYYLFEGKGIKFIDLILMDIRTLRKKKENRLYVKKTFEEGFIKDIDISKLKK